ncbi:biotin--[acetyl-CoA-carboxylase] ligase [Methylibium petroleiphilum]|uniref:biotin--[acetyl-CoA-carboxylase] ligase n=1 Tax=Methylibium petroleiphilum TaxID=105560 RepID=UPI001AC6C808|nr:biotin--[acetyl-CoA-carboxylase] ligase [Methylibium petroleiphilum]MBN9204946.1 biotin--[acetyl-CoA-carboxylase] ligase [Methylibium petroleiphilum]
MPDAAVPPLRRAVDAPGAGLAPLRWPLEALWAQLEPLRPGLSVEALVETDSTSTRLLERARSGDSAPCLLVAERQTAGRGRLGRTWFSDTGSSSTADGLGSLTFSLGLTLAPADWSGLSLAVGVALAEALHPRVRLKWPNDLWLTDEAAPDTPGRKLGGVLIETVALPDGGRHAVIGVGLNLARPEARPEFTQAPAGWREIEPLARAPELLARLAPPLFIALGVFEQQGFAAFTARFAARDALAGRPVQTTDPGAERGVADGVDARGALRVRTERGEECLIRSGEVSVRPC